MPSRETPDERAIRTASPARAGSTPAKTVALHLRRPAPTRAARATRWPRRCSPTASIWSAARSSTTGRAASCRPAPRSPTRWSRSSATRRASTPNVRATVQELYDGLDRAVQNRWPSLAFDVGAVNDLASPMLLGRLLLQDLHVAEGGLEEASTSRRSARAAGLGVAPDQPDPDHYAAAIAHCDVLVRRRRRGRPRRRARRGRDRRARHPLRRAGRARRRAALRERRQDRRRSTAGTGRRPRSRSSPAMDNVRVLPRTTAFGYYAQNFVGLVERVTDHLADPGRDAAARAAVAGPRQAGRARHRRHRAAHGVCRQRPAGHHAGRRPRAPTSTTTASRSARMSASTRPTIPPMRAALDLKKAGVERRGDRRPARQSGRAGGRRGARRSASRSSHGRAVIGAGGKLRVLVDDRSQPKAGGAERTIAGRRAPDVGRLDAVGAPVLAVARQGRLRRRDQALPARRLCAGLRFGRRLQRHRRSRRPRSPRRCAAGASGGEGRRRQAGKAREAAAPSTATSWAGGMLGAAPGAGADTHGQGLRRFPERRHRQGHPACGARGHALDRARQALHHQRHGDRPGQDLQHARPGDRRRGARARPSRRSG